MQTLFYYQQEAVKAILDDLDAGYKRLLFTQATGTGKTTVLAELCRVFLDYHGYRILVLAHRQEIITQLYQRIQGQCGLDDYQIGIEMAESSASAAARVVIGSVMTVRSPKRLSGQCFDVIICDECHHSAAVSYRAIFERFGVTEGKCLSIGCTATAVRSDNQTLYAVDLDGQPVQLFDKKKKELYPASPSETIYDKHCYDFSLLRGIEEGFLVPLKGHTVETGFDLSDVETKTNAEGETDFVAAQLGAQLGAKTSEALDRTLRAINAWQQVAADRPTLVFCASLEHAHHSADLWRQAGHTAEVLDGTTDKAFVRPQTLEDFRRGKVRVLLNFALFTEGTDLPQCACIVDMRPTQSWGLYCQMVGRGTRPAEGVLRGREAAPVEERLRAIAASIKPDCLVIDLVDNCEKHHPCTLPSLLHLPVNLDLQGQSVTQAKRLLEEFEEVREQVIGECPTTFRQLQVRLAQVDLLRNSGSKMAQDWQVTERGFRYGRAPVGYGVELNSTGPNEYELLVKAPGGAELLRRKGQPRESLKTYLNYAWGNAQPAIEAYKAHLPPVSRGTLTRLTERQARCLKANGHTAQQIDAMPYAKAKALIDRYMAAWNARKAAGEGSHAMT